MSCAELKILAILLRLTEQQTQCLEKPTQRIQMYIYVKYDTYKRTMGRRTWDDVWARAFSGQTFRWSTCCSSVRGLYISSLVMSIVCSNFIPEPQQNTSHATSSTSPCAKLTLREFADSPPVLLQSCFGSQTHQCQTPMKAWTPSNWLDCQDWGY